jgi:predicted TIM-barrel fold metal-dependent hydrolase
MNPTPINRRNFVKNTALSAMGLMLGQELLSAAAPASEEAERRSYDIMKEVMKYRKIDTHAHANPNNFTTVLDTADRLGIQKMVLVNHAYPPWAGMEVYRLINDGIIAAVKKFPDRFLGYCTLNPTYQKESLEEMKRCLDQGLVGLKVYTEVRISDPLYNPIIEKCIEHKLIVHIHSECDGYFRRMWDIKVAPNASLPEDYVIAAKRYPEATFEYAHIGTGNDFEWACKVLTGVPNIYVNAGASDNEEPLIDTVLKYFPEDRIFFATDGSFYQAVGKILASKATDAQRRKIFSENFINVMKKGGRHVA